MLQCRRCRSFRLITLNKKSPQDNDVYRCQECGFLFSPASEAGASRDLAPREGRPSEGGR